MHVTPLSTKPRTKEENTNIWTYIDEIYNNNQTLAPNFWST